MWKSERLTDTQGAIMKQLTDNAHIVTMSNTRSVSSKHFWYALNEEEMAELIKEQHALDNGVKVIKVWHSDGSVCQHDPARKARMAVA